MKSRHPRGPKPRLFAVTLIEGVDHVPETWEPTPATITLLQRYYGNTGRLALYENVRTSALYTRRLSRTAIAPRVMRFGRGWLPVHCPLLGVLDLASGAWTADEDSVIDEVASSAPSSGVA